jgi:hypothetical protein
MLKIAAIAASVPAALVAGVASLGVMVVDVREGGPDGHRFVIPVPLVVAQAALGFAPEETTRVPLGEAARHLPLARDVIEALADGPDGEIVRVEEKDQLVVITKAGRALHVSVHEGGNDVKANVPLSLVLAALPDENGRISTGDIAGALWSTRFTDLVEVHEGDSHVRISVW